MAFIQLRIGPDVRQWVNTRAILRVKPRTIDDSACSEVVFFDGSNGIYEESPGEIMAAIEKANDPIAVHVAAESKGPHGCVWPENNDAMLNRKIGALEAEQDSARRTASVARANAEKLKECNDLLESQLKAWMNAASTPLHAVLGPPDEEPLGRYETPDSLVTRLRGLYRWATSAAKDATEASMECAARRAEIESLKAEIESLKAEIKAWEAAADPYDVEFTTQYFTDGVNPESLHRALVDAQRWLKDYKKKEGKAEKPLDPWRLMATLYFSLVEYTMNENKDIRKRESADVILASIRAFNGAVPSYEQYPADPF